MLLLQSQQRLALPATARSVTEANMQAMRGAKLTGSQHLALLAQSEHERLSVSQAGQFLQLDYGTLTPLMKRKEMNDPVTRKRS